MDEIIKIELFGEEFQFKPDKEVENPQDVVAVLSEYIQEAEGVIKNNVGDRNKIAILLLAAMNLSKDFNELNWQHSQLQNDVKQNVSSLMDKLNKGIELPGNSMNE